MYVIYLRRNNINGKCYVGQTSDFRRRKNAWNCLKLRYANKYIDNDRAEFGLENFTVEVLAETDSREEAWNLEQYYIKQYNSIWPNGYNLSTGGAGGSGIQLSDETKAKISENNARFWLGKHHSDEVKQKISENNRNNPKQSKSVYQYTLDGALIRVWPSIRECHRNGYNQGNVAACCRNCYLREGNNIYKNHIWSYEKL